MEQFQATESDAEDLSALGPQIEGVDCAVTCGSCGRRSGSSLCAPAPGSTPPWSVRTWAAADMPPLPGATLRGSWESCRDQVLAAIARHTPKGLET